jgi:hypothetical protein
MNSNSPSPKIRKVRRKMLAIILKVILARASIPRNRFNPVLKPTLDECAILAVPVAKRE